MQLSSILVALVAATGIFAQTADPQVNTPQGVTECEPVLLTFAGSSPPFTITVVPGGQAGAAPLTTIGSGLTGTSVTWNVNLPAGTSCTLVIRDSRGSTNESAIFSVLAGSSSSCLTGSPAVASTPVGTSAAAETTANAVTNAVPVGGTTTVPVTTTTTHPTVTVGSAATTSSKPNAASSLQPVGVAGLLGLVGLAALF